MIALCLIIVIGMFWISIKLLRDTQKQAKIQAKEATETKDHSVK